MQQTREPVPVISSDMRRRAGQVAALRDIRAVTLRSRARLAPAGRGARILVNSVPKAGTHLVMEALDVTPGVRFSGTHLDKPEFLLDDSDLVERNSNVDWIKLANRLEKAKRGQYVTAHLWAEPELLSILRRAGFAVVFVARDPRDVVVSQAAYIVRLQRHPHHRRFTELLASDEERHLAIIEGFPASDGMPGAIPFADRLRGHAPWLAEQSVLTSRFEDLIGPGGGGTSQRQVEALGKITEHIGLSLDLAQIEGIAAKVWSPRSATFRAGRTGQWRTRLDRTSIAAFDDRVDDNLLHLFGYER